MKIWKYIKFALWGYWRIPKGDYCSGSKTCPYWDKIEGVHHQEDGYCHWLGYGDQDINNSSREFVNEKTNEKLTASEMPFGVGLLWDGIKECGLRNYSEKEEREMYEECMKER